MKVFDFLGAAFCVGLAFANLCCGIINLGDSQPVAIFNWFTFGFCLTGGIGVFIKGYLRKSITKKEE